MRSTLFLAALALGCAVAAPGQVARISRVLDARDIAQRLEAQRRDERDLGEPIQRLALFLTEVLRQEAREAGKPQLPATMVRAVNAQGAILFAGQAADFEHVDGALQQLRTRPARYVVQCSLLTMPAGLLREHDLAAGTWRRVDEVEAGRAIKAAVRQGGSLKNLPETSLLALTPLDVVAGRGEARGRATGRVRAREATVGRVPRCECLPVGDEEVAFSVQWIDPEKPKDHAPQHLQLGRLVRLQSGGGAMVAVPRQDRAGDAPVPVLWLRFVRVVEDGGGK